MSRGQHRTTGRGQHRQVPRRATRAPWSILKGMVVMPLVFILASGAAEAYWSAGSGAGGNGASAATSVNQGATPTVSAAGQAVTVSWAARTLSNGTAVAGYIVKRYSAGTLILQTILSACTGTVAATMCTENSVPEGQWVYSVTPVFATNWRGVESLKSSTVTLDVTAPVNSITSTGVSGNSVKSGNTIYYRGAALGSFALTNAVSDSGSGPASSATATLGGTTTGWTHGPSTVSTPAGGPYVSTAFSWTAGTTSSPTEVVTGRDIANNATGTTLTFVNDSTAPSAGMVTYTDGYQSASSVAVTLTTGTDGGSGLATRQLQRKSATLTSGSCGTYTGFADIGAVNPTSPYTDNTVTAGMCYQYQYVVTDLVGNQDTATSTNASKIGYAAAVNATAGLISQWRLGESGADLFSFDTFTDTSGVNLVSHTGETGATWVNLLSSGVAEIISDSNRTLRNGDGYSVNYTTATPPSADYSVEADLFVKSNLASDMAGVIGRVNTTNRTFYLARYEQASTRWNLLSYNNGTYTSLGTSTQALVVGDSYRLGLSMIGAAVKLTVNGVVAVSVTDSTWTAAGKAGIFDGFNNAIKSNTVGLHYDNFTAGARAVDSKGTNHGDYINGPTLGVAGAITGDANTAVQFDGVNDYVSVLRQISDDFSIQFWFKSTQGMGTSGEWWAGAGLVDAEVAIPGGGAGDFGVSLRSDGKVVAGVGGGFDTNIVSTWGGYNNGAWHQVVFTRTKSTGALALYVDGAAAGSATGSTVSLTGPADINFGRILTGGNYYSGTLDEVAVYGTALSQTAVTNLYTLGTAGADSTGPTGGSVAASGLVGTGALYSISATLSLNLAKGTDPSGVATTGAQLLRATGTLTSSGGTADGACTAYGSYTLVTNDPVSPKSDIVADQACYKYQYVVADTLGNSTTYTSADIKVDLTAPTPAPSLTFGAFTNTYWSSGSTVYYRGAAASGSFTATASATDPKSGIFSYGFPALGTNWTSTPGSLGVNTYSWTTGPAVPGAKTVTATNNATGTSASTSFTPTADNTAPSAGTVSYFNGTQSGTTISVTFAAGTDAGSGVGTRLLQRASAPLSGTCGSYGAFGTVTNGTNPTSPLVDTVTAGFCYMYQYVVSDNVGNTDTATSTNVVKVSASAYFSTISGTAGLLSYWRLGDSGTASDTFSGSTGGTLQSHTGEIGATWTKHAASTTDAVISSTNWIRKNGSTTSGALYYSSAVPASADYTVKAAVGYYSTVPNDVIGVVGRLDTAAALGTYYAAVYDRPSGAWTLYSVVNGAKTSIGTPMADTLVTGTNYGLALEMTGSTIRLLVNGVQQISTSNTTITAAGSAGVTLGFGVAGTTVTDSTGMHLDDFTVTPSLADSRGTNTGDYLNGPTLGAAGAITGDSNTAATFDGSNDYGSVTRQISLDFSIEFWFKSTQGIGASATWSDGAGLVDADVSGTSNDFGVSLRSDGYVVAGVGGGSNTSIQSATVLNDGTWHHVVFTRTRSSGALALYIDGGSAVTGTGSTISLTSPAKINFGRIQSGTNYFLGSLDEVAVYNTVLSAATVTSHYNAR